MKELENYQVRLQQLSSECSAISDPALQSALKSEIQTVTKKFTTAYTMVQDKQSQVTSVIESTPPTEFTDRMTAITVVVEEVFPYVSKEFKYDEIDRMKQVAETLKVCHVIAIYVVQQRLHIFDHILKSIVEPLKQERPK